MRKHLEVALLQLGVEEAPRGSNWGNDIAKYLHSVGIDFPASWCMAYVIRICRIGEYLSFFISQFD